MASNVGEITKAVKTETALLAVQRQSATICQQVNALVVRDQTSYSQAVELYQALLKLEKEIKATHEPVIQNWYGKHKAAVADRDKDLVPVQSAKTLAKGKASTWQAEQDRIRAEAERQARIRAEAEAREAQRIAREAAEAEAKRLADLAEAERLRQAEEAEAAGASVEQITEILDAPIAAPKAEDVYVPPQETVIPTIARTYEKPKGFSTRVVYSANLINKMELIKAAAANPFFSQYLDWNESAINKLASASKEAFSLPGCSLSKRNV
jgi:hypothetical protein